MGAGCCRPEETSHSYDTRWTCCDCMFVSCSMCCFCCMPQSCFNTYMPIELREHAALTEKLTSFVNDPVERQDVELYEEAYRENDAARLASGKPIGVVWEEIYRELQTGDLILFRCTDTFGSYLVTAYTGEFTHVGMVVVRKSRGSQSKKVMLLLESVSHADELYDFETDAPKSGVRQVDLLDRLTTSNSHYFGVVKLRYPSQEVYEQCKARAEAFMQSEKYKSYTNSKLDLCRVAFDCGALGHNQDTRDSYFCSQLVCKAMQEAGIVSEELNAAATSPSDFFQHDLRFVNGIQVDALYYMQRPDSVVPATPGTVPRQVAMGAALGTFTRRLKQS